MLTAQRIDKYLNLRRQLLRKMNFGQSMSLLAVIAVSMRTTSIAIVREISSRTLTVPLTKTIADIATRRIVGDEVLRFKTI